MGDFRLAPLSAGANPMYWSTVEELLSQADEPIEPDASFQPFAESAGSLGGGKFGRGFSIATWLLNGTTPAQRYALREICPGLSARVYIETITNEFDSNGDRIWIQAAAVMNWTDGEEDIQSDLTLDLEIVFTELVEVE